MPRRPGSCDWPWDPDLQATFDALDLTWKVLRPGQELTPRQLGSSPGDTYYTGTCFVFEYLCPPQWVVHELAHWLICRDRRPRDLRKKNYGYEKADMRLEEKEASILTCGLQRHFGHFFLETADELSLFKCGDRDDIARYGMYQGMLSSDARILELVHRIDSFSAPYLDVIPDVRSS